MGRRKQNKPDRSEDPFDSKPSSSYAFSGRNRSTATKPPYRGGHANFTSRGGRSSNFGLRRNCLTYFYCSKTLKELSKKNSSEIIIELIAKKEQFSKFLESNLEPDWIVLTVAILSKVCSSAFTENKIVIINVAAKASFTETLKKFVANQQYKEMNTGNNNEYFWNNTDEFFVNMVDVCECLIETIPTKACEVLPKLLKVVDVRVSTLKAQQRIELSETTKDKIKSLIQRLELYKEELEQKRRAEGNGILPPNNFRTLSVYPTCEEILSPDPAFVRKNIIEGRYDNVEHYLDVQFRLLKEDFVGPLRQGISEYFDQSRGAKKYMKFSNVKIHPGVVFRSPIFENGNVGVLLNFINKNASNRIFSPRSKSFNYGSLVCFTKDYFGSVLFGKVLDRDWEKQHLIVSFEAENNNFDLNVPYLMVECKIFFEPYYHVLKALQCMSEVDFPMRNHLIDVDSNVEPPGYLDEGSSVFTIHEQSVDLFGNNWPTADQLQLNSTQYSAFQAALTQKFVVIQGPPGTGKTYLGLQIVKTLLHKDNIKYWYNGTPILVICFTNHALDQFLQGLTSTTTKIVRVGGRSKCEELNEFNLRNVRNSVRINSSRINSSRINGRALYTWKEKVENLLIKLKEFSENLKQVKKYNHIIHFTHFECIDENIAKSWFSRASNSDLLTWLFSDRKNTNIKFKLDAIALSKIEEDKNDEEPTRFKVFGKVNYPNVIDDQFDVLSKPPLTVLDSKYQMWHKIKNIQNKLQMIESNTTQHTDDFQKRKLETHLSDIWDTFQYFNMRMKDGETSAPPRKPHHVNYHSPHRMHPNDRWNLYFYWLNLYQQYTVTKLVKLQNEYQEVYKSYSEIRNMIDTEIMKSKLVVGMTTTGAARLQTTLQTLKCRIVVVEEAAEVLESHVTVSLTSHCQHLILIGDHQQLRPTTADYRIGKKLNLGISMFERMVRNKIQCNTLGVQHRMRPEIANLIVPNIYPELENHHSVTDFPPILGMASCLYFIHHEHQELDEFDTKSNLHEAKFLVNLALYLRQNGYKPEDITILVAYSGQFFAMRDEVKRYEEILEGVRICVLDNYQGEECKIILLSLVRNNPDGKIGFLKIENRVCVALSRAKEGLYIMGNINLLCNNSEIWPKIKEVLVKQNSLGNYLPISCENHPNHVIKIREPEDFENLTEGGCSEIRVCESLLNCGHCPKTYHIFDSDHQKYVCTAKCSKVICVNEHTCQKMCYQDCGYCTVEITRRLECGHYHNFPCNVDPKDIKCQVLVTATLPCGHEVLDKPCSTDGSNFKCSFPCGLRIKSCGHACKSTCHIYSDPEHLNQYRCRKPCEKIALRCTTNEHKCHRMCSEKCLPCEVIVEKSFPNCNHMQEVECSADMKTVRCLKPCKKLLPCGHKCPKYCYEPCGDCLELVVKAVDCGHQVKIQCSEPPSKRFCINQCPKQLICGHPCKNRCKDSCTKMCLELVEQTNKGACGHNIKIECHMFANNLPSNNASLLKFCREPCSQILECSHKCSGICGECFHGSLHLVCSELVENTNKGACGHNIKVECHMLEKNLASNDTSLLKFCREPCSQILECSHKCSGSCGECFQGRLHLACSEKCGITLICGHKCKSLCSDVCQPCGLKCSSKCSHTKCEKKCWQPCIRCEAPCSRECKHRRCNAECWQKCTVESCQNPCEKMLTCGHLCVGFCGEPCPQLCRICDEQILTEIFLGYEDEEDAKFVLLDECKHVIESKGLERYFHKGDTENGVLVECKRCPRCETPLESTLRYKDYIKKSKADAVYFQRKAYGDRFEMEGQFKELKEKLEHLEAEIGRKSSVQFLLAPIQECYSSLANEKKTFNLVFFKIIQTKLLIFESIYDVLVLAELNSTARRELVQYLHFLLEFLGNQDAKFTTQIIIDFEREMCRLQRIAQIFFILYLHETVSSNETKEFIFRPIPYTNDFDDEVKQKLEELYAKLGQHVPDIDRRVILNDIGINTKRWFYCPNGHYYMDCGAPSQIAKCDQC